MVAVWNKTTKEYTYKWSYTNTMGVLAMSSNTNTKRTAVLFKTTQGHALAFLKWSNDNQLQQPVLEIVKRGYNIGY